jgi:transglutaminase-like putative cysteine protease
MSTAERTAPLRTTPPSGTPAGRPPSRSPRRRSTRATRPPIATLRIAVVCVLAVLIAIGGLGRLLDGFGWWLVCAGFVVAVLGVTAVVRSLWRRPIAPLAAGALTLFAALTLVFAADTAILGIVPTLGTVERFDELLTAGSISIQEQGVPADAVPGILFILAGAAGLVALAIDALVFVARTPALTGVPLLLVVAAPGFVRPEFTDPFAFVLVSAAWLLLVYSASARAQPAVAIGFGAIAIVTALVVPLVLPPVEAPENSVAAEGYSTGLNPIIDLGNDLRRADPVVALTYTTTADDREYLRMTTLDEFTEGQWSPRVGSGTRDNDPETITPAPGRAADVPVLASETTVQMGNVRGRWLPVPYAPTSVTGLVGSWVWDPETLNLRTARSSVRGQQYTVASELATPTSDQLRAVDPTVTPGLEQYIELPEELPPIVREQALLAVGDATTNYDKAIALQQYFRGGDFTYSEEAPVDGGYDGTSAEVIGTFLEEKSGYCVHFSSAMATMARTLDIPARIAVGFTTGALSDTTDDGEPEFTVTTDDLHAWPELYFDTIGWVRFEPTIGRGTAPVYPSAAVDDPATPDIDESTAAPVAPAPEVDPEAEALDPDDTATPQLERAFDWNAVILAASAIALLVVLAVPAMNRVARRRSRMRALHTGGSVIGAWDELRDTALDLGWRLSDAETPREFVARLCSDGDVFAESGPVGGSPITDTAAVESLARLRAAVEQESFAGVGARSSVPQGPDAVSEHDVHEVLRALRRGVSWRVRARAALAPASVLVGWFAGLSTPRSGL